MEKGEFLKHIDELLELAPGTLTGRESLRNVGWDSLAIVGFMALCDEQFGLQISPIELRACETADDLFVIVQHSLAEVKGR